MSFRRDYCFDQISGDITEIVSKRSTRRWKPCPHRSCHAPSRATRKFYARAHALHAPPGSFTRLHASSRAPMRIHALSRARFLLLTSALSDVITATSHHVICWRHCHVICWCHPWPGRWPDHWPVLTFIVDFDLWLTLTIDFFARVDFYNPSAPYPVFRVDFNFAVYFCIFCF